METQAWQAVPRRAGSLGKFDNLLFKSFFFPGGGGGGGEKVLGLNNKDSEGKKEWKERDRDRDPERHIERRGWRGDLEEEAKSPGGRGAELIPVEEKRKVNPAGGRFKNNS